MIPGAKSLCINNSYGKPSYTTRLAHQTTDCSGKSKSNRLAKVIHLRAYNNVTTGDFDLLCDGKFLSLLKGSINSNQALDCLCKYRLIILG